MWNIWVYYWTGRINHIASCNSRKCKQCSLCDVRLAKWLPIIQECATSGLSKAAWCEANDVNPKKLYYWQRKVRTALMPQALSPMSAQVGDETTTFTPVPLSSLHSTESLTVSFIPDVVLKYDGLTVEITNSASPEILSMIGGILRAK